MSSGNYDNPFTATWNGISQIFQKQERIGKLSESDRLDGKVCMVTGANSGLGFAVATQLAERGARVIMACRSGIPEAGEKVKAKSGSENVEMLKVDLSSFSSIRSLVDELLKRNIHLDILVCNAAVVPKQSRRTEDGFDEMFQVNYLSKIYLLKQLLESGIIRNSAFGNNFSEPSDSPRIIFVSSESHRSPKSIDFDSIGTYEEYTMGKTIALYGYYKLLMTTFANELSRRLNAGDKIEVPVHALCPGPVNSNIAREAPGIFKPLISVIFSAFFRDPETAAEPVLYLAAAKPMGEKTLQYLHLMAPKAMDDKASDPGNGKKLWKKSEDLLAKVNAESRAESALSSKQ